MMKRYFIILFLSLSLFSTFASTKLHAVSPVLSEQVSEADQIKQPPLVQKVTLLAALSLLPFGVILFTSFLKMVVVLSLLRQALGVQNSPPNPVINGIALLMAVYVMFPTGLAMYSESQEFIQKNAPAATEPVFSNDSVEYMVGIFEHAREPMRKFLMKNSLQKHRTYFYQLAKQKFPPPFKTELKATDFIIVMPAYITSQVKGAFEIGVLLYLPFFVIDLVVSNILLAMGMMMLSPLTIALPLKLLLLVMVDGWTLLVEGIVLTYR